MDKPSDFERSSTGKQLLSVEQWYEYAAAGVDLPVTTLLHGVSMEPLIRRKRDAVTIIPLKREPVAGDIVLFRRKDGAFVVHRFFRCIENTDMVQTWGDNCLNPDEPIERGEILGLAVSMNKNGSTVMLDTDEQREYGVNWMNGSPRRRLWFSKKNIERKAAGVYRAVFKPDG